MIEAGSAGPFTEHALSTGATVLSLDYSRAVEASHASKRTPRDPSCSFRVTCFWVRPLTRRVEPERLYRLTSRYVDFTWPLATRVRRIPKIGKTLNRRLLAADYSELTDNDDVLREWSQLDTFDMVSTL